MRHTCKVTFAIGENNIDIVWCDVLPMDCGDVLLGQRRMYDESGIHMMLDNTNMFVHDDKTVMLHPI